MYRLCHSWDKAISHFDLIQRIRRFVCIRPTIPGMQPLDSELLFKDDIWQTTYLYKYAPSISVFLVNISDRKCEVGIAFTTRSGLIQSLEVNRYGALFDQFI